MTITSFAFVCFSFGTLILYYLLPSRFQWCILLASSIVFYVLSSAKGIVFILFTTLTIYTATFFLQLISDRQKQFLKDNKELLSSEERNRYKEKVKRYRKSILISTLVINLGIMCFVKYSHFTVETLNSIFKSKIDNSFSLIIPLGLSFYTFQATGYLLNVYWNNSCAERNPLKVLLFVSFFPQITQGPISEYEQLSKELFSEHTFTYHNFSWGFWRLLWGFMKKMVIADTLAPWVKDVFLNYNKYSGITTLIGAFLYSIQIYADFSGYMDIMCGYCEMLGIRLIENFERPYFSKSIAEYWRRWHISLGAWFKSYIYYPIGVSKWNRNLGLILTKRIGKSVGKNIPASIALVIVWLCTGLWHGASWAYVAWGGVNGIIIIISMWLDPVYNKAKAGLKIRDSAFYWRAFQVLRTFVLITFIKVLPEVGTLSEGFGLWRRIFTEHSIPASIAELLPFMQGNNWWLSLITKKQQNMIVLSLIVLWIGMSFLQRKKPVRAYFAVVPLVFRMTILLIGVFIIVLIGIMATQQGGFMYAQF